MELGHTINDLAGTTNIMSKSAVRATAMLALTTVLDITLLALRAIIASVLNAFCHLRATISCIPPSRFFLI
jgi:hypothetical protein